MSWFGKKPEVGADATRIEALEKKVAALQTAYDDWFDLVAPELGFRAQERLQVIGYRRFPAKVSPRVVEAVKIPERSEIVRIPPKVGAKKAGAK